MTGVAVNSGYPSYLVFQEPMKPTNHVAVCSMTPGQPESSASSHGGLLTVAYRICRAYIAAQTPAAIATRIPRILLVCAAMTWELGTLLSQMSN